MGSETYHEPYELLSQEVKDMHRAIVSLMEELEAIDWYSQRAEACGDEALREVLLHNKDEEIEHAMMTLEWLLRRDKKFAEEARTYLFTDAPITMVEEIKEGDSGDSDAADVDDGCLGIGSLKERS